MSDINIDTTGLGVITQYIGIGVSGPADDAWRIECPCGVVATFPLNGLPEEDTPHPCGNPDHWSIRYWDAPRGEVEQ